MHFYFLRVNNSTESLFAIGCYRKKGYIQKHTLYFHGFVGSTMAGFFLMLERDADPEITVFIYHNIIA